jgi:2-octaprenylphenol hydroxylase
MHAFDIVIVGGGTVGLTQAIALKNSGLSVAVVESHVSKSMPSGAPQLRVSALTLASENVLQNLGAWQHLDPNRLCSYVDMQVWDQDSFGKINFSADEVQKKQLGHIIENQAIRHSLWTQAQNN